MGLSQPAESSSGLQAFINGKQTKQTTQVLEATNVRQTPNRWVCPNPQSPPAFIDGKQTKQTTLSSDGHQCQTNPEQMGLSQPAESSSGLQAFIDGKQTKQTTQVLTVINVLQLIIQACNLRYPNNTRAFFAKDAGIQTLGGDLELWHGYLSNVIHAMLYPQWGPYYVLFLQASIVRQGLSNCKSQDVQVGTTDQFLFIIG
ncbi:hypothetical protein C8R48DRAFT_672802 [Suillus tomentosus]|nr:hypothetical protein C8R48DRAFT_672802 [Suillus tomentosus]